MTKKEINMEEITVMEFFKQINQIPNYTAKNIKMKLKDGEITIGEMSVHTEKVSDITVPTNSNPQ